jgi:RNA polymerase sigma-70 factor (ECF subfamily)
MHLDRAAFEALYVRLERRLYNAAYRYVWHVEDARDVVQEAFVKLWDARERIDVDGAEAYAWRAVLNTAMNRRRWRKLRTFVGLEPADAGLEAASTLVQRGTPFDALDRKQDAATVRRAIDALPEDLRRVVLLSEVGGLKHAEIATIVGIAVGTVASRRSRALAKLRASLTEAAQGPKI